MAVGEAALERLAPAVQMELRASKVPKVQILEFKAHRGMQAHKEIRDFAVLKEIRDLSVLKETKDRRVLKETKEIRVSRVQDRLFRQNSRK